MVISIFLAKLIGLFLTVGCLATLVNRKWLLAKIDQIVGNEICFFMSGFAAFLFGLFVVLLHNVWEWSWPLLITLVGWLSIIKGLIRLFAPHKVAELAKRFADGGWFVGVNAFFLVVGIALVYYGFSPVVD